MWKKVLKRAGLGCLAGIVINDLISAIGGTGSAITPEYLARIGDARAAMLLELLLVGLFGAICMGGTMLYDVDRLPLAAATAIHCLLCILPFAPLALLFGWCKTAVELLIMAGFQVLAFFIVWLILYLSYQKEIRKLNEMQKDYLEDANQNKTGGTL